MEPQDFCYWLQGFFEIQDPTTLNAAQVQEVKNHLSLVFSKKTPNLKVVLSPSQEETRYCSHVQDCQGFDRKIC